MYVSYIINSRLAERKSPSPKLTIFRNFFEGGKAKNKNKYTLDMFYSCFKIFTPLLRFNLRFHSFSFDMITQNVQRYCMIFFSIIHNTIIHSVDSFF